MRLVALIVAATLTAATPSATAASAVPPAFTDGFVGRGRGLDGPRPGVAPVGLLDVAGDVPWYPLPQSALDAEPMDEERVTRLLGVVREAFALEPPAWEDSRYGLRVYVRAGEPRRAEYISTVERLDPLRPRATRPGDDRGP